MKPFNIEAARRGEKLVTRDGRPARIICFDAKSNDPIVALVANGPYENVFSYHADGRFFADPVGGDDKDLFMAETGPEFVYNRRKLDSMDKNRLERLPFDIKAAKAGAMMVTRDGRFARLIMSNCKGDLPLVVIVEDNGYELACNYNINGRIYDDEKESGNSNCDLFMVGTKAED